RSGTVVRHAAEPRRRKLERLCERRHERIGQRLRGLPEVAAARCKIASGRRNRTPPARRLERFLSASPHHRTVETRRNRRKHDALMREIAHYLATVELFRSLECEPSWRSELETRLPPAPRLVKAHRSS